MGRLRIIPALIVTVAWLGSNACKTADSTVAGDDSVSSSACTVATAATCSDADRSKLIAQLEIDIIAASQPLAAVAMEYGQNFQTLTAPKDSLALADTPEKGGGGTAQSEEAAAQEKLKQQAAAEKEAYDLRAAQIAKLRDAQAESYRKLDQFAKAWTKLKQQELSDGKISIPQYVADAARLSGQAPALIIADPYIEIGYTGVTSANKDETIADMGSPCHIRLRFTPGKEHVSIGVAAKSAYRRNVTDSNFKIPMARIKESRFVHGDKFSGPTDSSSSWVDGDELSFIERFSTEYTYYLRLDQTHSNVVLARFTRKYGGTFVPFNCSELKLDPDLSFDYWYREPAPYYYGGGGGG